MTANNTDDDDADKNADDNDADNDDDMDASLPDWACWVEIAFDRKKKEKHS